MPRHETPIKRRNPSGETVWVARWTDRYGKRHSAGTRKLKREAQALIDAAYRHDESQPLGQMTIGTYYDGWLRRYPRSLRTEASYKQRIEAVLDVKIDRVPLRDWRLGDFRHHHAHDLLDILLRDQKRAAKGAKGILVVLGVLYSDAMRDREAEYNPFHGVRVRANDRRVVKPARKPVVVTWGDMHRFAAACGPYEPMVRVLSDCGLRLGELLPLERADFHDGLLEVRRTAWRGEVQDGTKTDHGEAQAGRTAPVAPRLREMLAGMPRRIDTRLMFPSPDGGLFTDSVFYKTVWNPARKATGLDVTPHDFRHSWVSLMRHAGIDPQELAAVAGHTEQTANAHYVHRVPGASVAAFEHMTAAVGE